MGSITNALVLVRKTLLTPVDELLKGTEVVPVKKVAREVVEQPVVIKVPAPPPLPSAVSHFSITELELETTFEGTTYFTRAHSFDFLDYGTTYADVAIFQRNAWEVKCGRLGLTNDGESRALQRVDQVIGKFASKGFAVKRGLIVACLVPLSEKILEAEHRLKTFA